MHALSPPPPPPRRLSSWGKRKKPSLWVTWPAPSFTLARQLGYFNNNQKYLWFNSRLINLISCMFLHMFTGCSNQRRMWFILNCQITTMSRAVGERIVWNTTLQLTAYRRYLCFILLPDIYSLRRSSTSSGIGIMEPLHWLKLWNTTLHSSLINSPKVLLARGCVLACWCCHTTGFLHIMESYNSSKCSDAGVPQQIVVELHLACFVVLLT